LIETQRARMPAFFETSNSDLPSYAWYTAKELSCPDTTPSL
jgi:hypothetical protein